LGCRWGGHRHPRVFFLSSGRRTREGFGGFGVGGWVEKRRKEERRREEKGGGAGEIHSWFRSFFEPTVVVVRGFGGGKGAVSVESKEKGDDWCIVSWVGVGVGVVAFGENRNLGNTTDGDDDDDARRLWGVGVRI